MVGKSKVTNRPPTMRDIARASDEPLPPPHATAEVNPTPPPEMPAPAVAKVEQPAQPQSLVDLCLTRQGDIITDSAMTVRIPAPALLQKGERVIVRVYRVKPNTWIPQ